jgi:hypothetical protein
MFAVRAKRANVARRLMHKPVPYHFILSFETFAALASRTVFYWTVVWAVGRVHVCVRTAGVSM